MRAPGEGRRERRRRGMDIGVGASEDGTIPTSAGTLGVFGGGGRHARPAAMKAAGGGCAAGATAGAWRERPASCRWRRRPRGCTRRAGRRGSAASGGAAPNRPAVPAVAAPRPATVSGARGGLSAGPAAGRCRRPPRRRRRGRAGDARVRSGRNRARRGGGARATAGSGRGRRRAGARRGGPGAKDGFSGRRSAQKNRQGAGGPSRGAEVDDGDESEDGEEGVSPAFVPAEEGRSAREQQQNA